jgi:MATE family multidrug resistance protein
VSGSPSPASAVTVAAVLDTRSELRRLLVLAWPVVLGQVAVVLLGVADVIFAGRVGPEALAAISTGHIWGFGTLILGIGLLRGLDPLFSQAWGAGDTAAEAAHLRRGLVLAAAAAVPVIAAHLFAAPGLLWLRQPAAVIPLAAEYCAVVSLGVLPAFAFAAVAGFLQGRGDMKPPAVALGVANVVNLIGNAVLVFGVDLGPLGAVPAMGAIGCAWATTVSRFATLGTLLFLAAPTLRALPATPGWARPAAFAPLLRIGLPVSLQTGFEVWAFSAAGVMMGMLGAVEVAAHAVAINIASLTFMVPFGLGAAASTRVGNLIGAGHAWARAAGVAVATGAAFMAVMAAVLTAGAVPLARLFTPDPATIAVAALLLPVAGAFQLFDGVQAVAFGVLRGVGDTRAPAVVNLIGYWGLGLPLAWWWGVERGGGPVAIWAGLALGLAAVAAMLLVRVRMVAQRGAARL